MKREEVYDAIDSEREYQNVKWREFDDANNHYADWILYMERHLQKCKDAVYDSHNEHEYKENLRKIIALGVAAAEQTGLEKRTQHVYD